MSAPDTRPDGADPTDRARSRYDILAPAVPGEPLAESAVPEFGGSPRGHALPAPAEAPLPGARPRRALGPDERALKRERLIDILWNLQRERGWLDEEAVAIAARECALTPEEVDEIASFYNLLLRRPAGRVQLFVCDSISCHLNGADALMSALASRLGIAPGEVTADGQIGLLPTVCLGHCEHAPCVLAGEEIHGPCGTERAAIEELLRKVLDGRGPAQGPK